MRVTFVCPSGPTPVGGVIALYEFANGLARRGHEVRVVHMPLWGRRIDSFDDLARYRFEPEIVHDLLREADPHLLPDADVVFHPYAPARCGLPALFVQGFEILYGQLERKALRTPCLKICVASWLVEVGDALGVPRQQLRVVPYGLDHERFRVTQPMEHRPRQVAVLYNPHPAKGWDVAIDVLHEVHQRLPDLRVAAFGTDRPKSPIPSWIGFHPDPLPEDLVKVVYNQSQVFLQASDYEGFGFTALEALACGCALVTTDNGGSRDYAVPDATALVADPGDVSSLARHVTALLEDARLRERLAEQGARTARRFDWDLGSELLERELERYLADPLSFLGPMGPADPELTSSVEGGLAARILRGGERGP